jgi:UDP-N-acetylmuramoyl-L-alanyl-D-glutamate--2,6-diaminopimelate ligase
VKLSTLTAELVTRGFTARRFGAGDPDVYGVACDSRQVESGDLFVALPGRRTDGKRFVREAVAKGAAAVAIESGADRDPAREPTLGLEIDDLTRACGPIAAAVYGDPSRLLTLVGVTGTNGKTSCTYLLESILSAAGERAGVIGTVSARWPGYERKSAMTTPDAPLLQATLRAMVDAGCGAAAIEVSSHALAQHRVEGCEFRAAIFTNLTRDHLDYHADEEEYFSAKALLFLRHLAEDGIAILNADDAYAMRIAEYLTPAKVRTFSLRANPSAWAVPLDVRCGLDGLHGRIRVGEDVVRLDTALIGLPNLANVLAAAATARALGVTCEAVERGLAARAPVPGRLERVGSGRPAVLVDYAHTPDALERTLATTREMTEGRLIVVFGCGGDRDPGKRPMMGRAAEVADVAILTSDNPRSEDPMCILEAIEAGLRERVPRCPIVRLRADGARGYYVEPDRERAIAAALTVAGPRDVVVIAGKGHEDYQEVAGVRRPFDDREVVRRIQATGGVA